jgi:hypothetical protein
VSIAAVLCTLSGSSAATIYVGNVGSDSQFNTYMNSRGYNVPADYSKEIFAAEFRFGNNTGGSGGEREVGLHRNLNGSNVFIPDSTPPTSTAPITPGTSNPGTASATGTLQYAWGNNTFANVLVDFSLSRSGNTVIFSFGNNPSSPIYSATFSDSAYLPGVNFLAIRLAANARNASNTRSRIQIHDLIVNGIAVGLVESDDTTVDGVGISNNFVFQGMSGDFTITGKTTIDWLGSGTPSNSNPSAQFKFFSDFPTETGVPEPSTYLMMGTGLAAMAFGVRRSRKK